MTHHRAFRAWEDAGLEGGEHAGTTAAQGALRLTVPTGLREYVDPHRPDAPCVRYDEAAWTSPEVPTRFGATGIVASWNAKTPPGTWLEVAVSVTLTDGPRTGWYVLGRWAETDAEISPTSVAGQDDAAATVAVDSLRLAADRPAASYRVRVALLRRERTAATPVVRLVGAVASRPAEEHRPAPLPPPAVGRVLEVPAYSQELHRGEYPAYDAGGQSWCSPTAVSMVLGYWGRGPTPADYAWVEPGLPDRFVPHAVRHTFDHRYAAAGNWSFNTAYAARFGVRSFVTRLRGLHEAALFIAAGIPLVLSVAFTRADLGGAGYDTTGHLLVLVGFDERGNPVCNDPASHGLPSNDEVRTTYDRDQLERAWIRPSGGLTYVVHPPDVSLPAPPVSTEPSW